MIMDYIDGIFGGIFRLSANLTIYLHGRYMVTYDSFEIIAFFFLINSYTRLCFRLWITIIKLLNWYCKLIHSFGEKVCNFY